MPLTPEQLQALADKGAISPDAAQRLGTMPPLTAQDAQDAIARDQADRAIVGGTHAPPPPGVPVPTPSPGLESAIAAANQTPGSAAPPPIKVPDVAGPVQSAPPGSLVADKAHPPADAVPVPSPSPQKNSSGGGGGSSQPSAFDTTTKHLMEERARDQELLKKQLELADNESKAKMMQSAIVANAQTEAMMQQQKAIQDANARLAQARAQADADDRAAQQRAIDLANRKVDPMDGFGTGQKVFMVLGMALGAFGSALAKTPNFAQQIVEGAINRNVERQREEIQNAKDADKALREISERKYGRAMSQAELDYTTAKEGYAVALQRIDQLKTQTNQPIDQNAADQTRLLLQQKANELDDHHVAAIDARLEQKQKMQQAAAAAQQAQAQKRLAMVGEMTAKYMSEHPESDVTQVRQKMAESLGFVGTTPGGITSTKPKAGEKSDEEKAQTELNANVKSLRSYDMNKVTEGTVIGNAIDSASKVIPGAGYVPGVDTARSNVNNREAYNNQVRVVIGAAYKMGTSATEPKNAALIKQYAEPYEILPSDSPERAEEKRQNLLKFLGDNAQAKGAEPASGEQKPTYGYQPRK